MPKVLQNIVFTVLMIFILGSCAKKFMVIESPKQQPPPRELSETPKVALVLGGGAFHGMAHVGVIRVMEDAGIPIDLIVGTSAGSMVGALYSDNPNIDKLYPLVKTTKAKDVFDISLFRSKEGFVSGKRLQEYLSRYISSKNIEDTKIPFVAVTTDIEKGTSVALKAGPIGPSVNASCAVPGIFEPVKMYGTTYVDGGVLAGVPVAIAREYNPTLIIAVRIMSLDTNIDLKNHTAVLQRSYEIAAYNSSQMNLKYADLVIAPNLEGIPMMSGKENEKLYKLGMEACKEVMPELLELLKKKNIPLKN
ncbi:MAG: patatin-like phospholipase family protein [Lentimicrobiaceae bacterium]|jgi:NTE family protein|nr:patatin-like phospholipase family protein [Lentimicrobiaceae bacterium]MCP4909347.1 patatin-like phospholipase family protein [Bacteroidota bacterium]MBT3455228.1 patatin-like phospholipase family protein [Lentimicrobiaceae bacterium]MBT3818612.1 patatin-like phospholipase family protein [Lentimicrobiaceae bacterium]MBT4061403.1 patatin-like phospholipase family protein [Lentimicrobiaceae bacterium]